MTVIASTSQTQTRTLPKSNHLDIITNHYNPPINFVRFYWLLYVTWCKFTGRLSRNNLRLRRYLNKTSSRVSPFIFNILHGGKTNLKFHLFPRSFASRPNIHFSDNLSALGHYQPTCQPPEWVYLLNISYVVYCVLLPLNILSLGMHDPTFISFRIRHWFQ